eukprot:gene588-822_t
MQPQATQICPRQAKAFCVLKDHLSNHRHDFLENLSAFLNEQFVVARSALINRAIAMRTVQKSEVVADIV